MVCAALATGNAVVLKPAEQAPACAKAVVDALHAGGVPLDALSLLPGGDEPGKALVADPRIHTIVFTGSCAAGLKILEQRGARSSPASATSSASSPRWAARTRSSSTPTPTSTTSSPRC